MHTCSLWLQHAERDGAGIFVNVGIQGTGKVIDANVTLTWVNASNNRVDEVCGEGTGGGAGLCVYIGSFLGGVVNARTQLSHVTANDNYLSCTGLVH